MTTKEICQVCEVEKSYSARYNEKCDTFQCNDCYWKWVKDQEEQYARARYEIEHDL